MNRTETRTLGREIVAVDGKYGYPAFMHSYPAFPYRLLTFLQHDETKNTDQTKKTHQTKHTTVTHHNHHELTSPPPSQPPASLQQFTCSTALHPSQNPGTTELARYTGQTTHLPITSIDHTAMTVAASSLRRAPDSFPWLAIIA